MVKGIDNANPTRTTIFSFEAACCAIIEVLRGEGFSIMKATGIVRRIDDLGRVVIPKAIRRTMRIRDGEPLEIYTGNDGEIIFKKYSSLGEWEIVALRYAAVLHRTAELPVVVCDRDHVIAVAGVPTKEMLNRRVSNMLEDVMEQRKMFGPNDSLKLKPVEGIDRLAVLGAPIIASGDVYGVIMFLSGDNSVVVGDAEIKLIITAAAFLGKQIEE